MMHINTRPADFNRIARAYRWLEYITFGRALERCRTHYISHLIGISQALVLGDGDGRFAAALLAADTHIDVTAVDTSQAMLNLLRQRCQPYLAEQPRRLRTVNKNALDYTPSGVPHLVVTHFFLDCLTQPELNTLTERLASSTGEEAHWLVSEFCIPCGLMRWPARILVRSLYLGFRMLTGLRVTSLPDHHAALTSAGFHRIAKHSSLAGILTSELWRRR